MDGVIDLTEYLALTEGVTFIKWGDGNPVLVGVAFENRRRSSVLHFIASGRASA